jgi:hypothetical protein
MKTWFSPLAFSSILYGLGIHAGSSLQDISQLRVLLFAFLIAIFPLICGTRRLFLSASRELIWLNGNIFHIFDKITLLLRAIAAIFLIITGISYWLPLVINSMEGLGLTFLNGLGVNPLFLIALFLATFIPISQCLVMLFSVDTIRSIFETAVTDELSYRELLPIILRSSFTTLLGIVLGFYFGKLTGIDSFFVKNFEL